VISSAASALVLKPSMSDDSLPQIAALVERAEAGDGAARDALFVALYAELHRLAERQLRRNGGNLTSGPPRCCMRRTLGWPAGLG
jgi:ECF sigma factor